MHDFIVACCFLFVPSFPFFNCYFLLLLFSWCFFSLPSFLLFFAPPIFLAQSFFSFRNLLYSESGKTFESNHCAYRVVLGHRNWQIETAVWNLAGFFTMGLETRWQRFCFFNPPSICLFLLVFFYFLGVHSWCMLVEMDVLWGDCSVLCRMYEHGKVVVRECLSQPKLSRAPRLVFQTRVWKLYFHHVS